MNNSSPEAVFNEYLDAFAARDFERMRATLSDGEFYYRSPVNTMTSADVVVLDISRVGQILDGIDRRRIFVDGDEVCAILTFKIRINVVTLYPVVLWAKIQNGRIASLESFFDATEYIQMFPEREAE